ncbi:class I SAM-dependent methyltransferase [Myroides sp. M-43]|uniref:class I SAM-dependent methyltransferase n=1 Tax=Myroides oncorhynchi TaxID=2893756 RepID=UPI001E301283|nr:class I SAM-dependent methyltransferase [Myroides oncorhynchi]MCC9043375.1 class I SAM-dependent methyltransferase [Myroides oncorhynchi]
MKTELLLSEEVQQYILDNLDKDLTKLAFKKSPFEGIEMSELLIQLESKKKSKTKLPTWFKTNNILFPRKLSIEQTSSEPCAAYKASLIQGNTLIDLTGGFGIDSFYFSQKIKTVLHCEMQEGLSKIVALNNQALGVDNIEYYTGDSLSYLNANNKDWDYIYVDPHRRNDAKEKVFFLSDCLPNVPEHLDLLFSRSSNILIKTSPLLDLQAGIGELKYVKSIHIVALNNEVKELLWILEKGYKENIELVAINITKEDTHVFSTVLEQEAISTFSIPLTYLYEPNAAILKTGKFDAVSQYFNLAKLHPLSHLYTSDTLVGFSGRRFKIEQVLPYNKQTGKEYLLNLKANVTTRNFPIKVEEIKKKWKMKDGGEVYLFFTTNLKDERIIILCSKL